MTAISVARIMLLFLVNSWIIIHLGRKPARGGRPPSESIIVKVLVVIKGILFHMWERDRVVVAEVIMKSINVVVVIRIYRRRLSSVIVGLNTRIEAIHPM